jgi:hypothetical protein
LKQHAPQAHLALRAYAHREDATIYHPAALMALRRMLKLTVHRFDCRPSSLATPDQTREHRDRHQ